MMPSDYQAIRNENIKKYGTDIARIGPMLLADRYDDRSHFIYELLQNAEDALARRKEWTCSRSVEFHLSNNELRVSHFGQEFDSDDVRGICGIGQSTKGITAIGRFGIGFKSVYAYTRRPQIHSGVENFVIESYVWPANTAPVDRKDGETVILLPLDDTIEKASEEIARGLSRLGATTLLFLRNIEDITWAVEDGPSGSYLRESTDIGEGIRRVTLIGQEHGKPDTDESWLVFSEYVPMGVGNEPAYVEIAFRLAGADNGPYNVTKVEKSPLVAYFPTVLETHLGFLVQGPFRTTPSRDNVPKKDNWNLALMDRTAVVLSRALNWLRDRNAINIETLRCLPIDSAKFDEDTMFFPLYRATKQSLSNNTLLPTANNAYISAKQACLGRTEEIRNLLSPLQLATLLGTETAVSWLFGGITENVNSDLFRYLTQDLQVPRFTTDSLVARLNKKFLELQQDEWILRLYEYLSKQPGIRTRLQTQPILRLKDGTHVAPLVDGKIQAFLPSDIETTFPTVKPEVCATESAVELLLALGLKQPDPVDDVLRNLLPKYEQEELEIDDAEYEADIKRILTAFGTDSKLQREKLLESLRKTPFVMAIDAADGTECRKTPNRIYLSTSRLRELFQGVKDVLLVDERYACLRGESVRDLLEASGAVRYLRPIPVDSFSWQEKRELRERTGHAASSGKNDSVLDYNLFGLDNLLEELKKTEDEIARNKAKLLWEELSNLEERRGKAVFTGEYTWTHYGSYRAAFSACFIRKLNENAWIPDNEGNLCSPSEIVFDSLRWKPNPFLLSKILFKPPIVDQLASEIGIEPGVFDLLKRIGITSTDALREKLGILDETATPRADQNRNVEDALGRLLGNSPAPTPPEPDKSNLPDKLSNAPGKSKNGGNEHPRNGGRSGAGSGEGNCGNHPPSKRTLGCSGGRPFHSYVGTHGTDEDDTDPDGLDRDKRTELEEDAISIILRHEPALKRTDMNNPGYDLFEPNVDGQPMRLVEVKAMTGGLADRPVGLSYTQFEFATKYKEKFWLYVVENAGAKDARIVKIQDPAGKAKTYTFDDGWLAVAEIIEKQEEME